MCRLWEKRDATDSSIPVNTGVLLKNSIEIHSAETNLHYLGTSSTPFMRF